MLMNAGHGFARNYGTTTNNNTTSMIEGNNPWKNFAAVANLATSFMGIPDISKPFGAFFRQKNWVYRRGRDGKGSWFNNISRFLFLLIKVNTL